MRLLRDLSVLAAVALAFAWLVTAIPTRAVWVVAEVMPLVGVIIALIVGRRRRSAADSSGPAAQWAVVFVVALVLGVSVLFLVLWLVVGILGGLFLWPHGWHGRPPYWTILGAELFACLVVIRAAVAAFRGRGAARPPLGAGTSSG